MIWIILTLCVIGYFIVQAINASSARSTKLAELQLKSSPEYTKRYKASMDLLRFCEEFQDLLESEQHDELQLLENNGLSTATKKRLELAIKSSQKQRALLKKNFDKKYSADDDPRYYFSEDEQAQAGYRRMNERQESITETGLKISRLKGARDGMKGQSRAAHLR